MDMRHVSLINVIKKKSPGGCHLHEGKLLRLIPENHRNFVGSVFGGHLDMITDRVSTCGFLVIVSHLYPSYAFLIVMLIVLDLSSHWFHVMRYSLHKLHSLDVYDRG